MRILRLEDCVKLPNLPGIYKIQHIDSGRVYIGKSVTLKARVKKYLSDRDRHINLAIKKHGASRFTVEALEVYPQRTTFIENYILERESFWIKFYRAADKKYGFNFAEYGSGGGVKPSEETRRKLSKAGMGRKMSERAILLLRQRRGEKHHLFGTKWSEQRRANHPDMSGPNNPCYGIPKTDEQKAKISATRKSLGLFGSKSPTFGIKKSPEEIEKMRIRATGVKPTQGAIDKLRKNNPSKRSICKFDLNGLYLDRFISASEAARNVDGDPSGLLKMAKLGKSYKGFIWKLEFPEENIDTRLKKQYPILQIDRFTGHIIAEWKSVSEASRALGILEAGIRLTIQGERNHAGNFFWKRKDFDISGLPPTLPHENQNSHAPYQEYYCVRTKEIIADVYSRDFDLLNYSIKL